MTERDAIDQLAALLDGEPVTDAPASLTALAELAGSVRDHAEVVAPTPAFRAALRQDLLAAADAPPGLVERVRRAWGARTARLRTSTRMAVATMTASSMLGTAGVAVAAQDALPGELLYDLKGLTENARLALAEDDLAEARLHLAFAQERLVELEALAGQLDSDQVVALLAEMDLHSEAGAEALMDGVNAGAIDADELRDFTTSQRSRLVDVLYQLPLLARPVAEDSLELLRRIEISAVGFVPAAIGCDCGDEPTTGDGPTASSHSGPTGVLTDIAAPGEGPAVPTAACDCVELPGGTASREQPHEDEPREEPADEQDEESLEPERNVSDPAPADDDGSSPSTTTTVGQLPLDPTTERAGDAANVDTEPDPVEGTLEDVGTLLD